LTSRRESGDDYAAVGTPRPSSQRNDTPPKKTGKHAVAATPDTSAHIRDNQRRGLVAQFLRQHVTPGSALSFVSAYFTVQAYQALRAQLDAVGGMRFLYGDPRSIAGVDPGTKGARSFHLSDSGLQLTDQLTLRASSRRCRDWIEQDKVQIRKTPDGRLIHGKLYHVEVGGASQALLGSSNFTLHGLGLAARSNVELNLVVDREEQRGELRQWFDELWGDSEDAKQEVLAELARLYGDATPEFVYYKTLFHLFEDLLKEQTAPAGLFERTAIVDTEVWKALFDFQRDGAKGAIRKIQTYNGCILADSVGLGKTFSALAVIKYFELRNHRVLVLCPKKLRDNWTLYLAQNNSEANPFLKDRFAYTVLSHTDLTRAQGDVDGVKLETLNWGNFDLVVIDESHNFRNDAKGARDADGNVVRKSRYQKLMEDILASGVQTKVMLLSATPVNNDLKDLRNQIYLVTEGKDSLGQDPDATGASDDALWILSIKETLALAQREFTLWAKQSHERDVRTLLERLPPALFTLLDALTIARSRKHLKRHYRASMAKIGPFPKRLPPEAMYAEIDTERDFPSYDAIHDSITRFQLSLYAPSSFVKEEFKDHYLEARFRDRGVPNFSQGNHEKFLIGMMKVNFLKRLESSVNSFAITMDRTAKKIAALEAKLQRFKKHHKGEDSTVSLSLDDEALDDEETAEAFEVGGKLKYQIEHLRVDDWLKALAEDREHLAGLAKSAQRVSVARDLKLSMLWDIVAGKVRTPTVNRLGEKNRKVIVFCAFADTARYLYDHLASRRAELGVHLALVTGGDGCQSTLKPGLSFAEILTHFSPRAKHRDKMSAAMRAMGEIDVLVATDCISEGQNLQDCDLLVNYDIHWNPVRIIQRFGRIDRLGSVNDAVRLVNFWPTHDLNKYINLKNRVEARMALVDLTATAEDNLLQTEEIQDLIDQDLRYRDKQLLRLKDEVLDLEDFGETVSLTEFSLDDFRMDLLSYLKEHEDRLQRAPLGLYAVVPTHSEVEQAKPGVIFCLQRRHGDAARAKRDNTGVKPLYPYFLLYVRNDGEVRYHHTHAKQVLDLLRALCLGKDEAHKALCERFEADTRGGDDMTRYTGLVRACVAAIAERVEAKSRGALFTKKAKLTDEAHRVKDDEDYELVTWVVILDEAARRAG